MYVQSLPGTVYKNHSPKYHFFMTFEIDFLKMLEKHNKFYQPTLEKLNWECLWSLMCLEPLFFGADDRVCYIATFKLGHDLLSGREWGGQLWAKLVICLEKLKKPEALKSWWIIIHFASLNNAGPRFIRSSASLGGRACTSLIGSFKSEQKEWRPRGG